MTHLNDDYSRDRRPIGQLVVDLAGDVTDLLAKEVHLLKAEMSAKADKMQLAVGQLTAGAICLLAGLIVLLQALVLALTNLGLGAGWSALIVGGTVVGVGLILLYGGKSSIAGTGIVPERAHRQLKQDIASAKEQVQ